MGKGKRTRNEQYQDVYDMSGAAVRTKRQPQKKDRSTLIMILIMAAIIVLSVALILLQFSGAQKRSITVVSSENYEVTGTMMSYYENLAYSNLLSQYYNLYYTYYFSGDAQSAYNYALQTMSQYTLDDFFDSALATAKEVLVLCEAAHAAGVTLDETNYAEIDEAIASIDGEFTANFGAGVKEKDVRAAMELQSLAAKYVEIYTEETTDAITEEEINKYIEDNKDLFFTADALKYAITFNASDYSEDSDAFEADKALADLYLDKLAAADSEEAFRTVLVEYIVERDFADTVLSKVLKELIPEGDALNTHKEAMLADLIKVLIKGEELPEVVYETGTLEEALTKVFEALKSTSSTVLASLHTHQAYVKDTTDETILWLTNADTAELSTKIVESSNESKYEKTVYMLTEALHFEDEETVNVGHILISAPKATATEEELATAKARAEEILATYLAGELSKEAFEALVKADSTTESVAFYDNVAQGEMVAEFDEWIFSADRKEIGETGIVKTDYGYHVMYWNGQGENTATLTAKDGIFTERYEAFIEEGTKKLTLNDSYIAKYIVETESDSAAA